MSGVAYTVESGLLILALAVLVGPLLAERLKIPGLVGLIFIGTFLGPFALDWIRPNGLVATVGAAGLLYLMFLAGLELDLKTFSDNRNAALTFGGLTFALPFGLSLAVAVLYLDFSVVAAALIGAMWASHTLVAYPEVKAARLDSTRAVGLSVAATAITDVLALTILAVASSTTSLHTDPATRMPAGEAAPLPLWLGLLVLAGFTLWLLPRGVSWLLVHVCHTRTQRFVVVLAAMAAGGVVGLLGGIEGLVGAFLAGIGINRLIPTHSGLMEHIEFIGAALLIPSFLVAVGLSIDPAALVEGDTIRLALVFIGLVVVGKLAAAVTAGLIFGFTRDEIGMLASLTLGQAAATLAIAKVGVATGIFDQRVMNAAVVTVVVTVFITSLGTRFYARRLPPPVVDQGRIGRHVLVQAPDAEEAAGIMALAIAIAKGDDGTVTPFLVAETSPDETVRAQLDKSVAAAVALGADCEGAIRIDSDHVDGVVGLTVEKQASLLILAWAGPSFPGDFLFGGSIDALGAVSSVPTVAAHLGIYPPTRVVLITGQYEPRGVSSQDVELAWTLATRWAAFRRIELEVFAPESVQPKDAKGVTIHRYREGDGSILSQIGKGDLLVVPAHVANSSRSYGLRRLTQALTDASLVVVAGPHRLVVGPLHRHDDNLGIIDSVRR
ncbi:MAG: cation:proton antiporter [Actinobacteria bacterium]|nr:cation:proton antiporter [Actinomycetota bacterium]